MVIIFTPIIVLPSSTMRKSVLLCTLCCLHGSLTVFFVPLLAEFNVKDIVQDLNRLLKLDSGATSAAIRESNDPCPESCDLSGCVCMCFCSAT